VNASLRNAPAAVNFQANGLGLIESHHSEVFLMDWRRDPFPKVLFVIGGAGVIHLETSQLAFRAPSVCVVPADTPHRLEDQRGNPVSLYGICLKDGGFPDAGLVAEACRSPMVDASLGQRLLPMVKELLAEERLRAAGSAGLQLSIVLRILVELSRRSTQGGQPLPDSRQRVKMCAREMEQGFWRDQDIDSAARRAGLSRRRFTQLFREIEGETWQERLTRLRIGHASRLLRETALPVRAVAFEAGYADLSHFHRTFLAMMCLTPMAWRRDRIV
jgi:AraC family L-rhamnose operon regulatory protein RhaS